MDFVVRQMSSDPDTVLVRYDCECGCKPAARHRRGSSAVDHEHCCCGNVHFVGNDAVRELDEYLRGRAEEGLDEGRGGYELHQVELDTPWGYKVPVAYGEPRIKTH